MPAQLQSTTKSTLWRYGEKIVQDLASYPLWHFFICDFLGTQLGKKTTSDWDRWVTQTWVTEKGLSLVVSSRRYELKNSRETIYK